VSVIRIGDFCGWLFYLVLIDAFVMPLSGIFSNDRHVCRFRAVSHEVSTVLLEVLFPE
jgi:hypothetical protein